MRRAVIALFALAMVFWLVPAASAVSDNAPHAVSWEQTDTMGAWVVIDGWDKCINETWMQSQLTFFRGGVGDEIPDDRFSNAGEFHAVENGSTHHSGDIWWIASGRAELISMNPFDPCDISAEFPVKGEFHGQGMMRITESVGDISRDGTTCSLHFTTHLTGDPTFATLPPVTWAGNFVAHCDDGATIHLGVLGPTPGSGLEPGGIQQFSSGIILDK